MVKTVLACAIIFSIGCGRDGFKASGRPDNDAEVCENILCNGNWEPPVGLVDGGTDEDGAVDEEEPDGGSMTPEDDAGNAQDGGQEPETDGSTGDSSVPGGLTPETLVGRWAVNTAVLKTCSGFDVVDGSGEYESDEPIELDAELNATWLKGGPDCTTPSCHAASDKLFAFVSFDGETLIAELVEEQNYRKFVLEIVFSDANTFAGVRTHEGLGGFCPCGADDCEEPTQAVRGVREATP